MAFFLLSYYYNCRFVKERKFHSALWLGFGAVQYCRMKRTKPSTLNVDCRMACKCQIVCAAADFVCTQSCYIRQRGRWCSAEGNFRLQPRNREFLQIRRYEQQSTNQEQKRHLRRIHRFGSWRRKLKIIFFFCFFFLKKFKYRRDAAHKCHIICGIHHIAGTLKRLHFMFDFV